MKKTLINLLFFASLFLVYSLFSKRLWEVNSVIAFLSSLVTAIVAGSLMILLDKKINKFLNKKTKKK